MSVKKRSKRFQIRCMYIEKPSTKVAIIFLTIIMVYTKPQKEKSHFLSAQGVPCIQLFVLSAKTTLSWLFPTSTIGPTTPRQKCLPPNHKIGFFFSFLQLLWPGWSWLHILSLRVSQVCLILFILSLLARVCRHEVLDLVLLSLSRAHTHLQRS